MLPYIGRSENPSQVGRDISISHFEDNVSDVASFFYEDVLTDKETLRFMNRQFSLPRADPNSIDIARFMDQSLQELMRREPNAFDEVTDFDEFQNELLETLRSSLTTQNPDYLSLNALEVNTKGKGLFIYLEQTVKDVRSELKKKRSELINNAIVKELSAVSKLLDEKKRDLQTYEQQLKQSERAIISREKQAQATLQDDYDNLMNDLTLHTKDKLTALQKK